MNMKLPLSALLLALAWGPPAHATDLAAGAAKAKEVCVACHGIDGKGNQDLGAPDLSDGYWMYGSSRESLRKTISEGRHGSMPAHRDLLGETRVRLVAAYVWSLSHNQADTKASTSAK